MRVLLVERNARIAAVLSAHLKTEGASVECVATGEDTLDLVKLYDFDIVVLNLLLDDMNGLDVVRRMRAGRIATPVLALTIGQGSKHRVTALGAGADDAVDMPIDGTELIARMRAIVRRSCGYSRSTLQVGGVSLDLETHKVMVGSQVVHVTRKEFAILELLMLRRNVVLTKEVFLNHLYGGMDEPEVKIIDVFICKLRKKLAEAGASDLIGTVWGRGYTVSDAGQGDTTRVSPPEWLTTARRQAELAAVY